MHNHTLTRRGVGMNLDIFSLSTEEGTGPVWKLGLHNIDGLATRETQQD